MKKQMIGDENKRKSLVKEAGIFHINDYLTKEEADQLLDLLNDPTKLKFQTSHYYDHQKKEIVTGKNHRKSYWLGDHAQASGYTDHYITDRDTGEKIFVPTDYVMPHQFPPAVITLKEKIEKEFGVKFNSCLVGLYDSPEQKIGFHSDCSESMGPDPQIASISLGRPRLFKLKKQRKFCKKSGNERVDLILEHGSLLIMKDGANERYLHCVMKDPDCNAENIRLNLTFRNYDYHPDEKKIIAQPWN